MPIASEVGNNEIFVCASIRNSQIYDDVNQGGSKNQSWIIYSTFEAVHEKLLSPTFRMAIRIQMEA